MSEPLDHFRAVCRESFSFLIKEYNFVETAPLPDVRNPFMVQFTNGDLVLRVIGEGWGTVARVEYISSEGEVVPAAILEPGWEPGAWRKRSRRAKLSAGSQDEQIRAAAARIRDRDRDILGGQHERLRAGAVAWKRVLAMNNDPSSIERTVSSRLRLLLMSNVVPEQRIILRWRLQASTAKSFVASTSGINNRYARVTRFHLDVGLQRKRDSLVKVAKK